MSRVRRVGDRSGPNNPNWKGGVRKLGDYVYVYRPGHPRAVKFGQTPYVLRAVVNLEKKIGRSLSKNELPHHTKHKLNDNPRFLRLMTQAEHRSHHSKGKSNEERARIKQQTDKLAQQTDIERNT